MPLLQTTFIKDPELMRMAGQSMWLFNVTHRSYIQTDIFKKEDFDISV